MNTSISIGRCFQSTRLRERQRKETRETERTKKGNSLLNRTIDRSIIEKMCAVTDGAARSERGGVRVTPRDSCQGLMNKICLLSDDFKMSLRQPHAIVKIVLARLQSNEAYGDQRDTY